MLVVGFSAFGQKFRLQKVFRKLTSLPVAIGICKLARRNALQVGVSTHQSGASLLVLDLALNKPMAALCCSREFPISTEELLFK